MRPVTLPPPGLLFGVTFLPEDFAQRLKHFKAASGLTWDAMAACMGVDPRQLRRWRGSTGPAGTGCSPCSRWRPGTPAASTCCWG